MCGSYLINSISSGTVFFSEKKVNAPAQYGVVWVILYRHIYFKLTDDVGSTVHKYYNDPSIHDPVNNMDKYQA